MAEFTEVMRAAKRMCDSFGDECSECPLKRANTGTHGSLCVSVGGGSAEMYKLIEERVMQWAAAHPDPAYPSWNEWYQKNFLGAYRAGKRVCPALFGDGANCYRETDCDKCRDRPISADVAVKLGIRPERHDCGGNTEGGEDDERN